MELLQAVLLGVVQGLTEFIPVSSSAHLVLVPYLLAFDPHGLAFDVALHVGTLLAVVVYFRAELVAMVRGLLGLDRTAVGLVYRRLALLLAAASVPVAVVGFTLQDLFEEAFASPLVPSFLLFVTAVLLVGGERLRSRRIARTAGAGRRAGTTVHAGAEHDGAPRWTGDWVGGEPGEGGKAAAGLEHAVAASTDLPIGDDPEDPAGATLATLSWRQALLVGLAQTLALFPGISRSGATITMGLASGLSREAATRFSFMLSLPALVGAAIVSLPDLREPGPYSGLAIGAGVLASFLAGYLAIRFLVALVARRGLAGFAVYCCAAGAVGLLGYLMIGPPPAA